MEKFENTWIPAADPVDDINIGQIEQFDWNSIGI
jgi:hypothetical protein